MYYIDGMSNVKILSDASSNFQQYIRNSKYFLYVYIIEYHKKRLLKVFQKKDKQDFVIIKWSLLFNNG